MKWLIINYFTTFAGLSLELVVLLLFPFTTQLTFEIKPISASAIFRAAGRLPTRPRLLTMAWNLATPSGKSFLWTLICLAKWSDLEKHFSHIWVWSFVPAQFIRSGELPTTTRPQASKWLLSRVSPQMGLQVRCLGVNLITAIVATRENFVSIRIKHAAILEQLFCTCRNTFTTTLTVNLFLPSTFATFDAVIFCSVETECTIDTIGTWSGRWWSCRGVSRIRVNGIKWTGFKVV